MTTSWFELRTNFEAETVISDDSAPVLQADQLINPSGGALSRLATRRAPELGHPGVIFWLGEQAVTDLRSTLSVVRRVGLQKDGALIQADRLDDPFSLDGIGVLQIQQGLRLVNQKVPRFRFMT